MVVAQITQSSLTEYSRCEHQTRLQAQKQNPDYQGNRDDDSIAEKVDQALRKDSVLRSTDYGEIDVDVVGRTVYLSGYVNSRSNQRRAITAAEMIPGVLEVKSYLFSDDNLIRAVAGVLGKIEHSYGVKFFTGSQNGVVGLNGKVGSETVRNLAEQYAASVPGVRGVINSVRAPGVDAKAEDQRFFQPIIGVKIYFRDGQFGIVQKVIINPSNRRVLAMIVRAQYSRSEQDSSFLGFGKAQTSERNMVIPVSNIRYLTKRAGFLHVDGKEVSTYRDFESSEYKVPRENWMPPYPYCPDEVLFPVESLETMGDDEHGLVIMPPLSSNLDLPQKPSLN